MVIAVGTRKYSLDAVIGQFSSFFPFIFNFSFCLFCSICIKLEIGRESLHWLTHRLPFITSFRSTIHTTASFALPRPLLFDYWNCNIFSENSWIIIVIHWTTIISNNLMACSTIHCSYMGVGVCVCLGVCVCIFEHKIIYACIPYYPFRRQNRFFSS